MLKVLKSFGFDLVRQHGSHMILRNKEGNYVVVPSHDPNKGTYFEVNFGSSRII
ncbi:MAG: type II toxin-antitoxin system HicA family toxin [Thermoproteota archaeon]